VIRWGRIEKGLESPRRFSWGKSTIKVFEEVLGR